MENGTAQQIWAPQVRGLNSNHRETESELTFVDKVKQNTKNAVFWDVVPYGSC
jgi:hypothetical protein